MPERIAAFKEKGYFSTQLFSEYEIADIVESVFGPILPAAKGIEGLEELHVHLHPNDINSFRMQAIRSLNQSEHFRDLFLERLFPLASSLLGTEIAAQKNFNLLFAFPEDRTSQIPLHTDVLTGHSPFEITVLLPFTRLRKEHELHILPKEAWLKNQFKMLDLTLQEASQQFSDSFERLALRPGEAFVFRHSQPHGNRPSVSETTHVSLNFRLKGLFTPYAEKGLGDYFIPWKISPMTELVLGEEIRL